MGSLSWLQSLVRFDRFDSAALEAHPGVGRNGGGYPPRPREHPSGAPSPFSPPRRFGVPYHACHDWREGVVEHPIFHQPFSYPILTSIRELLKPDLPGGAGSCSSQPAPFSPDSSTQLGCRPPPLGSGNYFSFAVRVFARFQVLGPPFTWYHLFGSPPIHSLEPPWGPWKTL